jgi:hypothetical protein
MIVVLISGYGLFYLDYSTGVYTWFSANSPFTADQVSAMAWMELSADGYAFAAGSGPGLEIYGTQIKTNTMWIVRTKAQLTVDFGSTDYYIRALGINHDISQGLGAILTGPWAHCITYTMAGTGLSIRYNAGWNIYPGRVGISNWGGSWYTTTLDGVLATRVLRTWSGDFLTPPAINYVVPGMPYDIPHVHARAADYLIAMNADFYIYDQAGTNLVKTIAGDGYMDCDPTGQILMHLHQDGLRISSDQGDNWVDLVGFLPFIPKHNPLVLNLGDGLGWFISFNDEIGYLRAYITLDAGTTWVDAIGDLHSMTDPNAVLTVSHYA